MSAGDELITLRKLKCNLKVVFLNLELGSNTRKIFAALCIPTVLVVLCIPIALVATLPQPGVTLQVSDNSLLFRGQLLYRLAVTCFFEQSAIYTIALVPFYHTRQWD